MKKRIVVTGLGAITPIGIGKDEFWQSLVGGVSGIGRITRFDPSNFSTQIAGEVKGFDPVRYMDKKEARHMDLFTQYAVAAARMALDDSGIALEKEDRQRVGTIVGTSMAGISTLYNQFTALFKRGPSRISPFFIPMMIGNMAPGRISIMFGLHGPTACVVTACATGTNAIGDAFKVLQHGDADVLQAAISPLAVGGCCAMRAMSTRNNTPEKASRPFDKDRDGFVMGEGAGIVVLETLEHALARKARIYAEIIGYGFNADAYHITVPGPEGWQTARCMELAVQDAGIAPQSVDYINAHGTSTPLNDKTETLAIKRLFGDHAYKLAVSSSKSMTGHLFGAAGGIEFIATVLTVVHGVIPPTINYETPDPELDLDYVPNKARVREVKYALSNSFGFGGFNATVLVARYSA